MALAAQVPVPLPVPLLVQDAATGAWTRLCDVNVEGPSGLQMMSAGELSRPKPGKSLAYCFSFNASASSAWLPG